MKKAYVTHGQRFRRGYAAILQDVIRPDPNYHMFIQEVDEGMKTLPGDAGLRQCTKKGEAVEVMVPLYCAGWQASVDLQEFGARICEKTGATHIQAPLKRMWRCMEKLVLEYGS